MSTPTDDAHTIRVLRSALRAFGTTVTQMIADANGPDALDISLVILSDCAEEAIRIAADPTVPPVMLVESAT